MAARLHGNGCFIRKSLVEPRCKTASGALGIAKKKKTSSAFLGAGTLKRGCYEGPILFSETVITSSYPCAFRRPCLSRTLLLPQANQTERTSDKKKHSSFHILIAERYLLTHFIQEIDSMTKYLCIVEILCSVTLLCYAAESNRRCGPGYIGKIA